MVFVDICTGLCWYSWTSLQAMRSTTANLWGTSANLRDFSMFGSCLHFDRVRPLCCGSPGEGQGKVSITAGHLTQTSDSPWAPGSAPLPSAPQSWDEGDSMKHCNGTSCQVQGRGTAGRLHFMIHGSMDPSPMIACVPAKWEQGHADRPVSNTCFETPGTGESEESPGCWWDKSQVSASD